MHYWKNDFFQGSKYNEEQMSPIQFSISSISLSIIRQKQGITQALCSLVVTALAVRNLLIVQSLEPLCYNSEYKWIGVHTPGHDKGH